MDYLYRYIGFDMLVNMIQKSALTFVLPEVWPDPAELSNYTSYVLESSTYVEAALFYSIKNKVYAQCWSKLAESDAMWRIYSYDNKALRIKVARESLEALENVDVVDVAYSDNPTEVMEKLTRDQRFLAAWSIKRTAFAHEQEVRLISSYKFKDEQDASAHVKAFLVAHDKEWKDRFKALDSFGDTVEIAVDRIATILNAGARVPTKTIPFGNVSDFIKGVLVHPLAPQWYVDTIQRYCDENNIRFEGQSTLYKPITAIS